MKHNHLLLRLVVLVAAMMCALGASAIEAYACYTSSNTTLTFYYDNLRSSRTGTTYDLNTGSQYTDWDTDGTKASVTKVVFDPSFANYRPTTTYDWFFGMHNLRSITGISNLNTSEVTNMAFMFQSCDLLTSIDLSHFNTSKVTDMSGMFANSTGLTSLDLSSFNTSQVTKMRNMFSSCSNLRTISVGSGWSTAAVTASSNMFTNCTSLVGGQGTTYNSSNPTDKTYAHIDGGSSNPGYFSEKPKESYACYTSSNTTLTFYYDNQRSSRSGTTYDLNTGENEPGWKTDGTNANVTKVVFNSSFANARPTTTYAWFLGMGNLQSITGMSYLNTSEVTNMSQMFQNCYQLTSVDLSHFNTSKVTIMGFMFYYCNSLTSLDLSSFNTSKVTEMDYMFFYCYALRTIYVGNGWSTAAVTNSTSMFYNCTSLVGGRGTTYNASNPMDKTYAHIDGGTSNPGYFTAEGDEPWTDPEAYACYTSSNTTLTFYYDNQRSSRPGTTYTLNTGSNYPGWDTDGTNANVTKVVFDPSFAAARPTTTYEWFMHMDNLQSITGMSYLNTSEVTDMAWMFGYCAGLTSLDLSHFNTSKVTSMGVMFYGCSSLTSLDLSSFNTSKVTIMGGMFGGSNNLRTIYVGNGWSTAAVTSSSSMFYGCTSLVGGQGTTYNASNPMDKTYAHIDGGMSNPGYFTDINGPRPYACYTPSNTTLTFYYDTQRSSRPGTTYDLNTGYNEPGWETDGTHANVTKVVFDPSFANARPTTTCDWFYYMSNLQSITGMSYLNTSEVTDMEFMFVECSSLTSIDLSHFNTSKVTIMYGMFSGCSSLTSLDVSSFNTSQVTNMTCMFYDCSSLTSLDLSSFNTSKVTDMRVLFYNCNNLRTVYVGNGWSTAAVTSSTSMFENCTSLVGGQGTTYNSSNPTDKTYAHIDGGPSNPGYFTEFKEAYACYTSSNTTLTFYFDTQRSSRTGTTYDLNTGFNRPGWDTDGTKSYVTKVVFDPSFADARPTSTYDWFFAMPELESFTGMSYLNTSEVTNMGFMFCSSIKLTNLDLSSFNTAKVTNMGYMFQNCHSLISIDLSSFNTSQVIDMYYMFGGSNNLRTIYVGNGWSTAAVEYSNNMFYGCTSLVGGQGTTYDVNYIDKTYAHIDGGPSNPGYFTAVTEAYACYTPSNTTLTFYFDTQRSSRTGTTYDLNTGSNYTGWETDGTNASVTKVVFDPSFADARPTTTWSWFYNMGNLQSITGMSYLNTSEVTHMGWMFGNCTKLTSLDVSHFNTSQVVSMKGMFQLCSSLTNLDLSSFNTSKVISMDYMFSVCSNLRTVYVGNGWSTTAVTNSGNMFYNCSSLVGGQGTTYDVNYIDKTYAHIDGGPSNPGYFTDKNASLRGDVNHDGQVNITDVTTLISMIMSDNTSGNPEADVNSDGNVNITDVTTLITMVMGS